MAVILNREFRGRTPNCSGWYRLSAQPGSAGCTWQQSGPLRNWNIWKVKISGGGEGASAIIASTLWRICATV